MTPRKQSDASDVEIRCKLLWKLCRSHGWGSPVPIDDLVGDALDAVDQGRGRQICDDLKKRPFITYRRGRGLTIKNSPVEQEKIAHILRDECSYTRLQIEATLSRFEGF